MSGGLINLIARGAQDAPLTSEPEITFFKKVYKQHTPFVLWDNDRYLGNLNFNEKGAKILEKNGDLLSGQYFKIDIPYFDIIKSITTNNIINTGYDINMLDVTYTDINCYVLYLNNSWYVVPTNLFMLSNFKNILENIDEVQLQSNLLPSYISYTDLNNNAMYYTIQDSVIGLTNILRVNSSFWEQFWLNFINISTNIIYYNSLLTLLSYYTNLYTKLKTRIFNLYYLDNFLAINSQYFNFSYNITNNETETERYFEYYNNISNITIYSKLFDMDVVYKYCSDNNLNFLDYRDNAIQNNPLLISFLFNMLYSNTNVSYTFWKSYTVISNKNNAINNNVTNTITHSINEWSSVLNSIISTFFNINQLNLIYDNFINNYSNCETNINTLYNNLSFTDPITLYSKIKTILGRFVLIPNMQINFNGYYLATDYNNNITNLYNADNFAYLLQQEIAKYKTLNSSIVTIDPSNEMNNLTPVNIENIFAVIANELINFISISNNLSKGLQSFLILWKNVITIRLYQKFLDFYNKSLVNNITNVDNLNRQLQFYQMLTPSNMFSYQDFKNSFYSMFYKNSFMAAVNLDNNTYQKFLENMNIVTINNLSTDFTNVNAKQYNKLTITNTFNYYYFEIVEFYDNYTRVTIKDILYDKNTLELSIKYDNYYDLNSNITLYINNVVFNTNIFSFSYKIKSNEFGNNTLYLVVSNVPANLIFTGVLISLNVTYTTYLPLVTFYQNNMNYTFTHINKYILYDANTTNIMPNNNILIDTKLFNSSNIKILTINYMDNLIQSPIIDVSFSLIPTNPNNSYLFPGSYAYGVSFYTIDNESDISNKKTITLLQNMIVDISGIPISNDNRVIGRKIYRTKNGLNQFYLLTTIPDNIRTNIIDNINDINLSTTTLPLLNEKCTKQLVQIKNNNNNYSLVSYDNNNITFPLLHNNIKNIYIEEIDASYSFITNYSIPALAVTREIYKPGEIVLDNISDFSPDYLYYLINPNNFQENYKLIPSYRYISIQPPTLILNSNITSTLAIGTYYYKIAYYNTNTAEESLPSSFVSINTVSINQSIVLSNFPSITDNLYNGWKIYRTITTDISSNYYTVTEINSFTNSYEDTNADLTSKYVDPVFYMSKLINPQLISRPSTYWIDITTASGNLNGTYYYAHTYYNENTGEETGPSSWSKIDNNNNSNILLVREFNDPRISYSKLYRTKANGDSFGPYYFIGNMDNTISTSGIYTDNTPDSSLNTLLPTQYSKAINYMILKIPMNNMVPNFNKFISHSTDLNFSNMKNISDLNDYIFNKPFIAMVNNNSPNTFTSSFDLINSFTSSTMYFYNLNFNINNSSVITLNDASVNYILPISTQQFFIKDPSENYYSYNINNNTKTLGTNNITQLTFNPAFDDFAVPPSFSWNSNYYPHVIIDNMIDKLESYVNLNNDYLAACNIIDQTNNTYTSFILSLLNINRTDLYGLTSQYMLSNVNNINSIIVNNSNTNYNIINNNIYDNTDFANSSHDAPRLVYDTVLLPDNLLVNYTKPLSSINILSPIYFYYNSTNKIGNNMKQYFTDVNKYFTSHINYVNNNIDYINTSNPDVYKQQYISYQEIQQTVQTNYYDNKGTNTLSLLQPIIDNSFNKIIIGNNTINNFDICGNNILTSDYLIPKKKNIYSNTQTTTYNNNIYLGLIAIDSSSNFIFNDYYHNTSTSTISYYKLDDNTIIKLTPNYNTTQRFSVIPTISDRQVVNPYVMSFDISSGIMYNLSAIGTQYYLYNFNITFNGIDNIPAQTNYLINGRIIMGIYNNGNLMFLSPFIITLDCLNLFYQSTMGDNRTWTNSSTILSHKVTLFSPVNYYCNTFIYNTGSIYIFNQNYYDCSNIILFNNQYYFNINATTSSATTSSASINIINNVTYNLTPPMIIVNNYVYDLYYYQSNISNSLKLTDLSLYILLVDLTNKRHFMLPVGSVKSSMIPQSNYNIWLFPQSQLNFVDISHNITIDISGNVSGMSGLPTFCYYNISDGSNNTIYYYETGDTINVSYNCPYYMIKNTNITTISMIDNNMFNTDVKQLIQISKKFNLSENFISKKLLLNEVNTNNFDSYNYLTYKSQYINSEYNVMNYNSIINNFELVGSDETIVYMLIKNGIYTILQPFIFKTYENVILPSIVFFDIYSVQYYTKSFIPINSTYLFDNSNNLIANNIVGTIVGTDKYMSLSPSITIDSSNAIIINKGFNVTDITFGLNLWKIKGTNVNNISYYFYVWTLFTSDSNLINMYLSINSNLNINTSITEPYYKNIIPNYLPSGYTLILSYPNILDQSGNDIIIKNNITNNSIYYKYYSDTRHVNTINNIHTIKNLDYNGIINIKPIIRIYNSDSVITLPPLYFIIIDTKNITLSVTNPGFSTSTNTVYYSSYAPNYIPNNITIVMTSVNNIYTISNYNKLFLEMGEIIMVDNNYFNVLGLNSSNIYELELVGNINNNIRYNYNGYYTLGSYLRKDKKKIPDLAYQNQLKFISPSNPTISIAPNDIYYDNSMNKLMINNTGTNPTNYSMFLETTNQTLYLYVDSNMNLYLFDNFIKLKILDKIVDPITKIIYTIINIRDNMIILNTIINNYQPNTFVNFYLPYQPFVSRYINFDGNGTILSEEIPDNATIIIDSSDNIMNMYPVKNNKITNNIIGYKWVNVLYSNYISSFENSLFVPLTFDSSSYNTHPIEIGTTFSYSNNNFMIINNISLLYNFNFYYMQPVKIAGTYNYLKNITMDASSNYYFNLLYPVNIDNIYDGSNINITFTPNYMNQTNFYTETKFRYNFGLNVNDYDFLFDKTTAAANNNKSLYINMINYILYQDKLINVQTILPSNYNIFTNTPSFIFVYFNSIADNEIWNLGSPPQNYTFIYFHNHCNYIDLSGISLINNIDTLIGTYHLIPENVGDYKRYHLIKIIYPNKVKFYTTFDINNNNNNKYYLGNILPININTRGEITYEPISIIESMNTLEINTDSVLMVKSYNISFVGQPIFSNNNYIQTIQFNDNIIKQNTYNTIYIDSQLTKPLVLIYDKINNIYSIVSPTYLSNSITTIYTILTNYLSSAVDSIITKKPLRISDSSIDYNVDGIGTAQEYYTFPLLLSSTSINSNNYNYMFLDKPISNISTYNLNPNEQYKFNSNYSMTILNLNYNARTMILTGALDNMMLLNTTNYIPTNTYVYNKYNNINDINQGITKFNSKALRCNIINNSNISCMDILYYLKPWSSWSLLNSINGASSLSTLVNYCYLAWIQSTNTVNKYNNNMFPFSYLTNNEVKTLTNFLQTINTQSIARTNYTIMKTTIEPAIFANLQTWLNNPSFFLQVTDNINMFLKYNNFNATFDGNNIIFNNDTNPTMYNNEISSYITDEYIYDMSYNVVYRSNVSYQNINTEINYWINKVNITSYFAVSVHQLLRYLRQLGEQYIILINNFTNPLSDSSLNSLTYLLNRTWENNNTNSRLQLLDKLDTTTILYPYTINFSSNVIVPGSVYSIYFVDGTNIAANLSLNNTTIYPGQLNFDCSYNIKPEDFILVKKETTYIISNSTYLGNLWSFTFDPSFNVTLIDEIFWRNNNLTIKTVDTSNNNLILYIPGNIDPSSNDIMEVRNMLGIISINIINNNMYITFYSNNFNFVPNQTILQTSKNIYMLNRDSMGFYVTGNFIDSTQYNVTIINTVNIIELTNMMQYAYDFTVNKNIDTYYELVPNNSIIPMDFQLTDTSNNIYNPILVQSISSNIIQLIFPSLLPTNLNNIINTIAVDTDFTNKINILTKYDEYLYTFNNNIPATTNYTNTKIFIYDPSASVLEPVDPSNTSIYINISNNITYFTIINNYDFDTIKNKSYIQKNLWNISSSDYTISSGFMSINVPSDFVLNTATQYMYKVNNIVLDIGTFIYSNNILSFQFDYNVSGTIQFKQYYIAGKTGLIIIPEQNQKVSVNLDFDYQYSATNKFFILPLTIKDNLFYDYLYMIKTNVTTNMTGFAEIYYANSIVYLYNYTTLYIGTIFDEYHDGSNVCLIVSLRIQLTQSQLNSLWAYSLSDNIIKPVIKLTFYQDTFQLATYYDTISSNSIYMFMNKNVQPYNIIGGSMYALQASKFYLVSYINFVITNNFYPNTFIQNQNMKQQIEYSYTTIQTTEKPIFSDYSKLFSYIRFFINDQIIEELNEDVFNLNYNLYMTSDKRKQYDKIVMIKNKGNNGWELRIPLEFWFNNKPGQAIPIVALPYSELRLEYKLNDIKYILSNDLTSPYKTSIIPKIKLRLNTEFILLDTMERNLFGSYGHEYIIERYRTYLPTILSGTNSTIYKIWNGLIKDIYFIAKQTNNSGLTYTKQVIKDYDPKYSRYDKAMGYYKQYIANNNIYTSEMQDYTDDIQIILANNNELYNYIIAGDKSSYTRINNLVSTFSTWAIYNYDLLKYLMYYEDFYLFLINDIARINNILTIYLKYIYSTEQTINKLSPLDSILIKVNGTDLFAKRDYNYYTNVIPSMKFKNSLPIGYYCYSFSLEPNSMQWSGHLNFTNLDSAVIRVNMNTINTEQYQLNTVLKEYNILRIMSGMGSLAWVD